MDGAREQLLAGAGFAGDEDRQSGVGAMRRARRGARDLLGRPDALRVAVERLGRPERGALLLVAAVAIEGESGGNQLADRGQRAAMFESGFGIGEELPGLVAMFAKRQDLVGSGGAERRPAASRVAPAVGRR